MNLKAKKILVTGACGFIGSHLVESLIKEGCKVRAFVYYNPNNSWGWLDVMQKSDLRKIEVFSGDIRDHRSVEKAVEGIDLVFHLAALIGIPFSYQAPDSYVDTNIKGTLNVLSACRDNAVKKVLVTSTSEVYGTARYIPIPETHPLQGQSPYSASKIGADKIAESFYLTFGAPIAIVRPFNTYGPRQSARAIIPTIITQLLSGKTRIKLGSLHPTRDFTYVKDTVEGFLKIAKSDKTIGEEINIASESEVSIGELTRKLIKMINPKARIAADKKRVRPVDSEVERLNGSSEKLKRLTGWQARYTLEKGLEETVAWYRKNADMRLFKPDIYNI